MTGAHRYSELVCRDFVSTVGMTIAATACVASSPWVCFSNYFISQPIGNACPVETLLVKSKSVACFFIAVTVCLAAVLQGPVLYGAVLDHQTWPKW